MQDRPDNTIDLRIPAINPDGTMADDRTAHLRKGAELCVILTPHGSRLLRNVWLCAGCKFRSRSEGHPYCGRQDCDQWYTAEELKDDLKRGAT